MPRPRKYADDAARKRAQRDRERKLKAEYDRLQTLQRQAEEARRAEIEAACRRHLAERLGDAAETAALPGLTAAEADAARAYMRQIIQGLAQ